MVERCPDKTEVEGPIPSAPTIKALPKGFFLVKKEGRSHKRPRKELPPKRQKKRTNGSWQRRFSCWEDCVCHRESEVCLSGVNFSSDKLGLNRQTPYVRWRRRSVLPKSRSAMHCFFWSNTLPAVREIIFWNSRTRRTIFRTVIAIFFLQFARQPIKFCFPGNGFQ